MARSARIAARVDKVYRAGGQVAPSRPVSTATGATAQFTVTAGIGDGKQPCPAEQVGAGVPAHGVAARRASARTSCTARFSVTYKTAWFMAHRFAKRCALPIRPKLGGEGEIIESDEAYWGPKDKRHQ